MGLGWFKKSGDKPAAPPPAAGTGGKKVSVGNLLDERLIVVPPEGLDKDGLIENLSGVLCRERSLGDPKPFLGKVIDRENGISTTLDTGLAIPHARMDGLEKIVAVLGLVPAGVPDPKQPDLTIRAMFLFFSPNRQETFTNHLLLLRGVSSLMQPEFIDQLLKDPKASSVLKLIRNKETGG